MVLYIYVEISTAGVELDDYIVGVDDVPPRCTLDFVINSYGERFIEFLINSNTCMLNGRNATNNDFTSVSAKGSAVVDYCVASYDCLDTFF